METSIGPLIWTAPENKIYFPIFFAALILVAYRWWRSTLLIKQLGKSVQGKRFLHHTSTTRITLKTIAWSTALFLIFLTLLKPSWHKKQEIIAQEGRDLFVALDISRSMLAQDVLPSRLAHAKKMIKELVDALPSDRIGLILFSGSSFVQCPLTKDRGAFYMYLDQIDSDTIASGTTALDKAIEQALEAFKQSGTQKNKLILLFTDGEDFSSNLAHLKQEAQSQGASIFTIGLGTPQGAPIPVYDIRGNKAGHLKDSKGTVVISALNEGILQTLAHDVGGIYVHATKEQHNLKQLIALIEKREKEKIEDKKFLKHEQNYPAFLAAAFILLMIEWLL